MQRLMLLLLLILTLDDDSILLLLLVLVANELLLFNTGTGMAGLGGASFFSRVASKMGFGLGGTGGFSGVWLLLLLLDSNKIFSSLGVVKLALLLLLLLGLFMLLRREEDEGEDGEPCELDNFCSSMALIPIMLFDFLSELTGEGVETLGDAGLCTSGLPSFCSRSLAKSLTDLIYRIYIMIKKCRNGKEKSQLRSFA